MKRDPRTIVLTRGRCLKLLCPACGGASIVERPFHLKHRCNACGVVFKREEGFFVGAIMANVVATEVLILFVYLLSLLLTKLNEQKMLTVLFVIGEVHRCYAVSTGGRGARTSCPPAGAARSSFLAMKITF